MQVTCLLCGLKRGKEGTWQEIEPLSMLDSLKVTLASQSRQVFKGTVNFEEGTVRGKRSFGSSKTGKP